MDLSVIISNLLVIIRPKPVKIAISAPLVVKKSLRLPILPTLKTVVWAATYRRVAQVREGVCLG
jgi:hypothetical protein